MAGLSTVPTLNIATSHGERRKLGVSGDFVDAYNQGQMAQYNNEYNYWLWQQQQEYNKPVNQVARLKEAGLNPNFNSIDGTGNLSSIPTSSGNISPSVGSNTINRMNSITGMVSSIFKNIASGVGSLSTYANVPQLSAMRSFKQMVHDSLFYQNGLLRSRGENEVRRGQALDIENALNTMLNGIYSDDSGIRASSDSPFMTRYNADINRINSQSALNQILRSIKEYYHDNMQPQEKERLIKTIRKIGFDSGLSAKQLEWFTSDRIARYLAPIAKGLF